MWLWSFFIPKFRVVSHIHPYLILSERERESQKLKGVDDPPNLGMITRLHMVAN